MRKLILQEHVRIDNFAADLNGGMDFQEKHSAKKDESFIRDAEAFLDTGDTMRVGNIDRQARRPTMLSHKAPGSRLLVNLSTSLLWPINHVHGLFLVRVTQNTQFCDNQSKEQQNREDYGMTSISYLPHRGPHGYLYWRAMRSRILAGTAKLRISRIRALWIAITSPLIRDLFKSTRLA